MMKVTLKIAALLVLLSGMAVLIRTASHDVQAQTAPSFKYDPDWPKPLPNKWKMGGVTGLAVDKDDNVWVLNRPNDLVSIEVHAEQDPPLADCCAHAPAMIHIDKAGNVIGSFDAPQGHGMAVDKQGFIYIGQNTVRKYDPKTGKMLAAIPHIPETANGQPFDDNPKIGWVKGQGSAGPVAGFIAVPAAGGGRGGRGGARGGGDGAATQAQLQQTAFVAKYPPTTPMIVGGIEEIRTDDAVNEIYVADNSFGGRVMVFSLDKFEFKRGWGAYGHKLSEISAKPEDHAYTPGGPMPKEFVGHLTLQFLQRRIGLRGGSHGQPDSRHRQAGQLQAGIQAGREHGRGRLDRRRDVLARQGTEAALYLRPDEQPHLVPQSRGRARSWARWASRARTAGSSSACT